MWNLYSLFAFVCYSAFVILYILNKISFEKKNTVAYLLIFVWICVGRDVSVIRYTVLCERPRLNQLRTETSSTWNSHTTHACTIVLATSTTQVRVHAQHIACTINNVTYRIVHVVNTRPLDLASPAVISCRCVAKHYKRRVLWDTFRW